MAQSTLPSKVHAVILSMHLLLMVTPANGDATATAPPSTSTPNAVACKPTRLSRPLDSIEKDLALLGEVTPGLASVISEWKSAREACADKHVNAQVACLEHCSPELNTAVQLTGELTRLINLTAGATHASCGTFGDVMRTLQGGFTAYHAGCAMAKSHCESSCGVAQDRLQKIEASLIKATVACAVKDGQTTAGCKIVVARVRSFLQLELSRLHPAATTAKLNTCAVAFKKKLGDSLTSTAALLTSLQASAQCQDDSTATSADADGASTDSDCSSPDNQQKQECICRDQPRTPGCPNSLAKAGDGTATEALAGQPPAATVMNELPETPSFPRDTSLGESTNWSSDSSAAGLVPGGGEVSGPPTARPDKGAEVARIGGRPDVYSGDFMGGGARGPSSTGQDFADRPRRLAIRQDSAMVAGLESSIDLTGAGGRSNWEKIKIRYLENRPSLLPQD